MSMKNNTRSTIVLRGDLVGEVTEDKRSQIGSAFPRCEILSNPDDDQLEQIVEKIEIVFGRLPKHLYGRADSLRWLQLQGAGADGVPSEVFDRGTMVTNASGVHAEPISEHLLAMMLHFARDFPLAVKHQRTHDWKYSRELRIFELAGKRTLLLGTGAIGHAFARKGSALGMDIVGVRRSPEAGTLRHGVPREEGVYERIIGSDSLAAELPEADFLVVTLPLTPETTGMIGKKEIASMKPEAMIFNIGRGPIIDQNALISALQSGAITAAGLDVFDPEPLPADSPLWDMENVLMTTHYSGATPRYTERLWEIFTDNLRRLSAGEELRNRVDPGLGY